MAGYENRGYLLDRDYMVANPIGQRLIRLESYGDPGEFVYDLRKRGFTHILLNRDRLYSILHPKNEQYAEFTLATISEYGNLVYQSGPIELCTIRK